MRRAFLTLSPYHIFMFIQPVSWYISFKFGTGRANGRMHIPERIISPCLHKFDLPKLTNLTMLFYEATKIFFLAK